MRTLTGMCHVPIRAFADGTFSAVASRLGTLRSLGFDGILLTDFDDSCGTSQDMIALVSQAHALGFCVVPDLCCLTGGVNSPAPFVDAAIGQSLADGFVMSEGDMRFEDVKPTIQRLHKDRDTVWFLLSALPDAGARPDGMARRGFSPLSVLTAPSPDDAWEAQAQQVGKTRFTLVTPLPYEQQTTAEHRLRVDAAMAAACLLPGVPLLSIQNLYALLPCPDDAHAFALRRRHALLSQLLALRRRYPSLSESAAWRSDMHSGIWSITRRTSEGTLSLYINVLPTDAALGKPPRVRPSITYGLFSRDAFSYLLPYGYALYMK